MNEKQAILDHNTLKERIETMPEDSVLFRSDFPVYQSEFVGGTLAALVNEGIWVKLAQGIYTKPGESRLGMVSPSIEKVVQATSDNNFEQTLPTTQAMFANKVFRSGYNLRFLGVKDPILETGLEVRCRKS